ncbi:MAG: DUF2541 family protein [Parvularculaceae bacterium]
MRKMLLGTLVALSFAAMAAPAAAWDRIGTRTVTDHGDRDVITVAGGKRYDRIKVCVYKHPVEFYDLDVNYANGGHQDVNIRSRINPGDCTRNIDLTGDDRNITKIVLKYEETSRRRARAKVRVFAE